MMNEMFSNKEDWISFSSMSLVFFPKTDEFKHIAKFTNPAIIGVSESELDDSVLTSNSNHLLRCERNRQGGW